MSEKSHKVKKFIITSLVLFSFAIIFGAFGAHYVKNNFNPKLFETFKTGTQYHLIYSLFLLAISLIPILLSEVKIKMSFLIGILGILLFCGNCYLYTFTGIKIFAMIVPLGGLCFIISPILLVFKIQKAVR